MAVAASLAVDGKLPMASLIPTLATSPNTAPTLSSKANEREW